MGVLQWRGRVVSYQRWQCLGTTDAQSLNKPFPVILATFLMPRKVVCASTIGNLRYDK